MNQSNLLYRLQSIDTDLDHIKARLGEITANLAIDEGIREAEKILSEAQNQYDECHLKLRKMDDDAQALKVEFETNESSMYGGKIHAPKELLDLKNENESLKHRLASMEDAQLETMMTQDQMREQLQAAKDNLLQAHASSVSEKSGLLGEQTLLQSQQEKLQIEREAIAGSILVESLEIYQHLREQKRGVAVSIVKNNACGTCGAIMRPAELQEARSPRQMTYCTNCKRILYSG